MFPLLNREAGMSFAVFANLFGAGKSGAFTIISHDTFKEGGLTNYPRNTGPFRPPTHPRPRQLPSLGHRPQNRRIPPPRHLHRPQHNRPSSHLLLRSRNSRRNTRIRRYPRAELHFARGAQLHLRRSDQKTYQLPS